MNEMNEIMNGHRHSIIVKIILYNGYNGHEWIMNGHRHYIAMDILLIHGLR